MNNTETKRLLAIHYARIHAFRPAVRITSRRSAKSARNATGQLGLVTFRVVSEVPIERVFTQRKGI